MSINIFCFGLLLIYTNPIDGLNFDKNVTELMETYLPQYHKPSMLNNVVYIKADIFNIISVDEVAETLTTKLWFYIAYLVGIPEEVWDKLNGMYEFFPGSRKVWQPDVIVLNNVETLEMNWGDPIVRKFFCPATTNAYCGTLVVFPLAQTEITTCSYDVTEFPFDEQDCKIQIGPWFTDKTLTNFSTTDQPYSIISPELNDPGMSLTAFQDNSQWELVGSTLEYKMRTARHDVSKQFEVMEFSLKLERKPQFYIYTLICPCFTLSLLSVLSIYIPVESGEKIGLGVTILLAQVVNLLILSSLLPASSRDFPKIGYYFLTTIGIIVLSLVYNSFIINFYYHGYSFLRTNKAASKESMNEQTCIESLTEMRNSKKVEPLNDEGQLNNSLDGFEPTSHEIDKTRSEEEKRQRLCIITDHIIAAITFVLILIVHLIFFGGHL